MAALALGSLWLQPHAHVSGMEEPIICGPVEPPPEMSAAGPALPQAPEAFRVVVPGLSVGVAQPDPPAPRPELLALEQRLRTIIEDSSITGRFAIAVTDLQTGETIGAGHDRVQLSGCVMNLFAIVAALQDVDAGRYPLSEVDATIRQTIWASDATAARSLYTKVGGGDAVQGVRVVAALLASLGMHSSSVDHPPAYPSDSIGVGPNNLVTARDVNGALARIYGGSVLSPQSTAYLIEAMTHVKPGLNYLTAVVPAPAVVSHKNGFFWDAEGWIDNDASIVRFGPSLEYAYALTFLSEAVPTLYADIPLAQELVLEAWRHFDETY
jgi:beta-lactamase class A